MKLRNLICLLVLILITTSCATIFTGTSSNVRFSSVPPGAKIYVNGIERGVTPATVNMNRSLFNVQTVALKLDGYETRTIEPETSFQTVAIINLANPLFWAIDAVSGAIVKYNPKDYELQLTPKK